MSFEKILSSMIDSMSVEDNLNKLVPQLKRLLTHWQDPIRLVIMGEFKAGKSTLLNTLFGENFLATGIVAATAKATYIRYSEEKYIEVIYENGLVERKTIEEMEKLTSERIKEGKEQREGINYLNLYLPNPILKNIVLIDTPGLESPHAHHDLHAFDAYEEADDSMWIFKYTSVGSHSEVSVIKKLIDDGLHPIGIVNMIDLSDDDDIQPYINYEFEKLNGRVRKLIGISAKEANDAFKTNDTELLEISGFNEFISLIEEVKLDKGSRKQTRFEQSFLKFWQQLNNELHDLLISDRYQSSIQKIKTDLNNVKHENEIILVRLAEEESQMTSKNQSILLSLYNTTSLSDWTNRDDFNQLLKAIPQLQEWKKYYESYEQLHNESQNLINEAQEYKRSVMREIGRDIGFSKLMSTPKNTLIKYRYKQKNLLEKQRNLNIRILKINEVRAHLLNEKNFIQDQLTNYYRSLIAENKSSLIKKIADEKTEMIRVNLLSKKLLLDQIFQWNHLVDIQYQMQEVRQYISTASVNEEFQGELPHLHEQRLVEEEIALLNETINQTSNTREEQFVPNVTINLPNELVVVDEVPKYFLRNIRPVVATSAISIVASAVFFFHEPIVNLAKAGNEMLTNMIDNNNEEVSKDNYNYYDDYDYQETSTETTDQWYEALAFAPSYDREFIGYIDVDSTEIHVYQSNFNEYVETIYILPPYTSWEVYSENDYYYEIQEGLWVKKADVAHLFSTVLQEYVQYETGGLATIYTSQNEIPVYERANSESLVVATLGSSGYEILAFTENGWLQIGENAWVKYDKESINLIQESLSNNLNNYYDTALRVESTNSSFIPIFEGNSRDSAVIGYLEDAYEVPIYDLPSSGWANIGSNAWIEADKYLAIDWGFVPVEDYVQPIGAITVDANALMVREMDYEESNLLGILPTGTTVDVYEASSSPGWYRIGTQGWVNMEPSNGTFYPYYEMYPTGELAIGTVEVLVDMHVREMDHIDSESQGILKQGTILEVYEISPETSWYRIGYDAWISNSSRVVIYEDYGVEEY